MGQQIDAIFEDGVLKPVGSTNLKEGQHVSLLVETRPCAVEDVLRLARAVYEGLSPEDIEAVEAIALERRFSAVQEA